MRISSDLVVDDHEIEERFVRSMGADGQNPRRKATAVELRFDIDQSSLPADVQVRLKVLGGRLVTSAGVLVVVSRRYRSQERNREAARKQLRQLLREAGQPPKESRELVTVSTNRRKSL